MELLKTPLERLIQERQLLTDLENGKTVLRFRSGTQQTLMNCI